MNSRRVLCRRKFDWFAIGYPVFLIVLFYWLIVHFHGSPFRVPAFWFIVVALAAGQGIYLVVSWRSPSQLELDGDDLVVAWRRSQKEIRVPRHHVRIDKSQSFNSGYRLWCGARTVLVFFNDVPIQKLMESIHEYKSEFN